MNTELYNLAKKVGLILMKKKQFIVTAESCTGGLLAKTLTDIPGSSAYFDRGFVTYSNAAKQEVLGVKLTTLDEFGAVSEEVAKEMAEGALKHSNAQIAVAITGIAGPDGGTNSKPVGSVCISWVQRGLPTKVIKTYFNGDRDAIREQAAVFALKALLKLA